MKTDEELKQIAQDLLAGKIYSDRHIPKGESELAINMVFTPFMFLGEEDLKKMMDDKVVLIYEYLSEAGPREVNGMPTFMSFRTLTKDEFSKVVDFHDKIKSEIEGVK